MVGLEPHRRSDRGTKRSRLPEVVVSKALALLSEDAEIPLPLVIGILSKEPEVLRALEVAGAQGISRSTLQRRLSATELYAQLRRARKRPRPRGRWVPQRCHQVWHLDAKGPITKKTTSGELLSFHVMTALDGASRAVLAAILVLTPDVAAAVRVLRRAIRTYGLPDNVYADRGSIFDTPHYRRGLAVLGIHRVHTKPGNPQANGKIESYHHCLGLWFARRLKKQHVVDWEHLEQLFSAVIEYYQCHRNREIQASPREVLAGCVSSRPFPPGVALDEAFLESLGVLKAHPATGEVDLRGGRGKYIAPPDHRGRRLEILVDPEPDLPAFARVPATGQLVRLERAKVHPKDAGPPAPPRERWGRGALQALYDNWMGKVRPVAEPGFGLPEVFAILAAVCERPVPRTDGEATLVQRVIDQHGPFSRFAFQKAIDAILAELGRGRPVKTYLDALIERVVPGDPSLRINKQRRNK